MIGNMLILGFALLVVGGFLALFLRDYGITLPLAGFWQYMLAAMLFALAGAWLFSDRLAGGIMRQLGEVTAAAKRIAGGDWETEIRRPEEGEIGELASAINGISRTIKENVRELAESKGRLEAVLANMESGVLLFDGEGRLSLINPAAEGFLGVRAEEVMGMPHVEAVKNYSLSSLIDDVLRSWKPARKEISLIYPQERTVETHAAPIFGVGGEPHGVVVVLYDISEIKHLERVRAEFVANVSHELKTPVTAVKGFAETLLSGALYNFRAAEEFVNIINEEAERLSRLIHDLLELSRIESKGFRLRIEPLELDAEIKRIVDKLKPQFLKKELTLTTDLPPEPVIVKADRDQIEQVLLNLLDNSLKYTPGGGQVEVSLRQDVGDVVVAVKDTGIGIPPEDLPRIFERFYRVDKARSRKLGGTGLGLSIVKHIIEAHRGRVWVESEPGKGSQFYFSIPIDNRG
ncbi:MAG TPA: cell wall metabolism sensor histidine kinase WalK [Syntrophomonadaceae bacterium]|nr:cell wall metabolism sensor histidine kinase WalK [Syntrophomonadaceae bacterium]